MESFLSSGRTVWLVSSIDGIPTLDEIHITKFKQFLPAGPVAVGQPNAFDGHRVHSLVQLWSDRGLRTVSVAELKLKRPR